MKRSCGCVYCAVDILIHVCVCNVTRAKGGSWLIEALLLRCLSLKQGGLSLILHNEMKSNRALCMKGSSRVCVCVCVCERSHAA